MATMTIRYIDDQLKSRLRVQAAAVHGHSMEEEHRNIVGIRYNYVFKQQ